jgi:hypothetical protein
MACSICIAHRGLAGPSRVLVFEHTGQESLNDDRRLSVKVPHSAFASSFLVC